MPPTIPIDLELLRRFARRHPIQRLSLFGSILTEQFEPGRSDLDLLVEFFPESHVSLFDLGGMIVELEELLGMPIDLRTPKSISRYFREEVLKNAELIYEA